MEVGRGLGRNRLNGEVRFEKIRLRRGDDYFRRRLRARSRHGAYGAVRGPACTIAKVLGQMKTERKLREHQRKHGELAQEQPGIQPPPNKAASSQRRCRARCHMP